MKKSILRIKKSILPLSLLLLATTVSCQAPLIQSQVKNIQTQSVLAPLIQRPLPLGLVNGQVLPLASVPDQGFKTLQEISIGMAEPAIARPDIAIAPSYYYGGHGFNQFTIQFAEESIYKASSESTLLKSHENDVLPLLKNWDENARLIESRGQSKNHDRLEHIVLPGTNNKPIQVRPRFVFRYASSPKKETLNIYILDKEIRVHRMVWGEQNINLSAVKVDSDKALRIALAALRDKNNPSDARVFPERTRSNQEVIYKIPEDAGWQLNLNQTAKSNIRYYLNLRFQTEANIGVPLPEPQPLPPELFEDGDVSVGSAGTSVSSTDIAIAPSGRVRQVWMHASVEVDALSGKILSMNRPVNYLNQFSEPGFPGEPVDPCCFDEPIDSPPIAIAEPAIEPDREDA